MLQRLIAWLRRVVAPTAEESPPLLALPDHSRSNASPAHDEQTLEPVQASANNDEALLDNALEQWQAGDWQSLAALNRVSIAQHPERAGLTLLSAAAQAQIGDMHAARQLIRQAEAWGCSRRQIARLLISGTYLSLSRAALAAEDKPLALNYSSQAAAFSPQLGKPATTRHP